MYLKYFYDEALAHASYMVGCQRTGEAIVIDPARSVAPYVETAVHEDLRIVAAVDTHIHADYASGCRELAERVGARLYLSDAGPPEWKYPYAAQVDSQLLIGGDSFWIGNIKFDVLHTPGHTPESLSYVLTDTGGGADRPMGIFTGDFVFVGAIGRPDLLERVAGEQGNAVIGARQMFASLQIFKQLPDYLQVWPAHGAGSACGKGLGAVPTSTVGYEKLFNPALTFENEGGFIEYLLAEQPEAPPYFGLLKELNKAGPPVLGAADGPQLEEVAELLKRLKTGGQVFDLSPVERFAAGHVPGTFNLPLGYLAAWAGWLLDYERPLTLIASPAEMGEAHRILREIGFDQPIACVDLNAVARSGRRTARYAFSTPQAVAEQIARGEVVLVDVRAQTEWEAGHIPQARHIFLGELRERLGELPQGKPIVVQCRSGGRSAIGASLLQAAGYEPVINLAGGIEAWKVEGLPV